MFFPLLLSFYCFFTAVLPNILYHTCFLYLLLALYRLIPQAIQLGSTSLFVLLKFYYYYHYISYYSYLNDVQRSHKNGKKKFFRFFFFFVWDTRVSSYSRCSWAFEENLITLLVISILEGWGCEPQYCKN